MKPVIQPLLAVLLALSLAQQAVAHAPRPRVTVVAGPVWSPFWFPPVWHYPPPFIVTPPPPPPPPVYIEQAVPPADTVPYWYYCQSARAYYPAVATCPEDWLPVLANPEH